MKIQGKKLAWAIIHLVLFIGVVFADMELGDLSLTNSFFELLFYIGLMCFFAWRFIANLNETFEVTR